MAELYCICQQMDSGIMIECIKGDGGCNGWVHPICCGLTQSEKELDEMGDYVCPLCDPRKKSSRKEKKIKSESWKCKACGEVNGGDQEDCTECFAYRPRKRPRSGKKMKRVKQQQSISEDEDTLDEDTEGELLDSSDTEEDEEGVYMKKRKKSKVVEEEVIGNHLVIDKILGKRLVTAKNVVEEKGLKSGTFEYFVKWRGFSYMHGSWEREGTLLDMDSGNKHKIKRFCEKEAIRAMYQGGADLEDEELFSPDFLEIHRIIAMKVETPVDNIDPELPKDDGIRYLVKWRSLPYLDCTWERNCDITDDAAIAKFNERQIVPDESTWNPLPRPAIRHYAKLETSPPFGEKGDLHLRDYQLEGVNWLLWNWYNSRASILADEMGLGKTIQTLAFLDLLGKSKKIQCRGPFLIVAPLSLIAQWQNEADSWTKMDCVVYHGNNESREIIQEHEFYYLDGEKADKNKPLKFNILVTTYEIAIKDIRLLSRIHWRCMVVDEAHRLKNHQSSLVEKLNSIQRDHCILLTGTPLQNKTEELWALLNFVDSVTFPNLPHFLAKFGNLQDSTQVAELHKLLKPFLLRRVKEDVEKSLPPKEETIVEVELTTVQKQWYRAIYEKNTSFLYRGGKPSNAPNLMNIMMELRKCCNHPYLNNGVELALSEGLTTDIERHDMMVKCCGKMVLLDKLLPKLKEGGHKLLIFSQMVRVLDILEDYLRFVGHSFERLDGNIRGNLRQGAIDRFVNPEYNRFIMLLSTKAGGLGLNLTAADTVVIFDSDWNPQNDLQAQARAHRIGQTNSVKIYRLITRKTYEQHMFHRASLKLGLDKAVLTHMRQENENAANSKPKSKSSKIQDSKEIDELLKKGAYDVFRDDDTAAEQFCAADIDQILQRSSKVVQYEQTARSQFSKASFVSAATADDVDIDDPDFWKKAVGLDEPDLIDENLLMPAMRKRTRVTRFGAAPGSESDGDVDDDLDDDKDDEDGDTANKNSKEPREWTINGRDRLQRAMMHFGFGRWHKIRQNSGGSRSVKDVEQFSRAFVLQCGLCCAENSSAKEDSPFVKAAIRAAQAVEKEFFTNGSTLPAVLNEEEFLSKIKQGGAKRSLIRLDILMRLQNIISAACDVLDAEKAANLNDELEQTPVQPVLAINSPKVKISMENTEPKEESATEKDVDATISTSESVENLSTESVNEDESTSASPSWKDIDHRVERHGVRKVADKIELVDLDERPAWTRLTSCWDDEADRHCLMAIFLHGYGRRTQLLHDDRLCFFEREAATANLPDKAELEGTGADDGEVSKSDNFIAACTKQDKDESEETTIADNAQIASPVVEEEPRVATEKFQFPDMSQINRLLYWLVMAADVKLVKDEEMNKRKRIQADQNRQKDLEKMQRRAAVERAESKSLQLVQMDMLRHEAYLYNMYCSMESRKRGRSKDWTREEKRSLCYMIATVGAPCGTVESEIERISTKATKSNIEWQDIINMAHLRKSPTQVASFVHDKFFAKCVKIADMKFDPLAADQKTTSMFDFGGFEYVEVAEKAVSHGIKAKRLASLCLRRTKLLKIVSSIVKNRIEDLTSLMKNPQESLNSDGLPVWWYVLI